LNTACGIILDTIFDLARNAFFGTAYGSSPYGHYIIVGDAFLWEDFGESMEVEDGFSIFHAFNTTFSSQKQHWICFGGHAEVKGEGGTTTIIIN